MDFSKQQIIGPVCRFGPGGDFLRSWPGAALSHHRDSPSGLSASVMLLREMIMLLFGLEPDSTTVCSLLPKSVKRALKLKLNQEYSIKDDEQNGQAGSLRIRIVRGGRRFSQQPTLFGDDWQVQAKPGHISRHRIRTYHSTSKKSPSPQLSSQRWLFETDLKNAKTA